MTRRTAGENEDRRAAPLSHSTKSVYRGLDDKKI